MLYMILMCLVFIIFILQSIAFVTLFERHLLSLSQNRLGPQKVSFKGLLQPILDGIKLLKKQVLLHKMSTSSLITLMTAVGFIVSLAIWSSLSFPVLSWNLSMPFLFYLLLTSSSIYTFMLVGYTSYSSYAWIGALRAASQTLSLEVMLVFFLFSFVVQVKWLNFNYVFNVGFFTLMLVWVMCMLAELGRAPFDFLEGESELVSGYNIEFSSLLFTLLFLKEYGLLLFYSTLTSIIFLNGSYLAIFLIFSLLLHLRASFPRLRYDFLAQLFWLQLLPLIMQAFIYFSIFYGN